MGPIDGHDLPGLINFLAEIKHVDKPVLLHVKTNKGQGYEVSVQRADEVPLPGGVRHGAERLPGRDQQELRQDLDDRVRRRHDRPRQARQARRRPHGRHARRHRAVEVRERYSPTATSTPASARATWPRWPPAWARAGCGPFAAIYSTFIQRAFDQIWQEVVLNDLPVVFCMDRAGYVGDDGAVHHGFCDQAFLRPMPGIVLMAPSDEAELNRRLRLALTLDTASALRYPRDNVPACNFEDLIDAPLRTDAKAEWTVGRAACSARGRTRRSSSTARLRRASSPPPSSWRATTSCRSTSIDARFCKPVDGDMLARVLRPGHPVLTVEDHSLQNGFGTAVLEYAVSQHLPTRWITRLGHARSADRPRDANRTARRSRARRRRHRAKRSRCGSRESSGCFDGCFQADIILAFSPECADPS